MKYLIFTFLFLWCIFGYSQNDTELKRQAKEYFAYNRYEDALKTLQKSRGIVRNDEEGRFLIALCLYQLNRLDESADILNNLVANEKTPYPECWFYLGKIYHARHQFAEAGRFYKAYLKNISPNDPNRRMVVDIIRRCANGQQYQYKTTEAFVENLGNQVNTFNDEFAPVLSPNYEDRLYFSSARESSMGGKRNRQGLPDERFGQYFSDMYFCVNSKGIWGGVQAMPYQMNSPRHEVLLDFNKEGTALIYFKGLEPDRGEMLVDTFRQLENRVLSSDPFISPVDTRNGDRSPYFYNDTLILFASTRPGGYGGLDLYKIAYRNGSWSAPQNLGPEINTPYDETAPFLARDGKTLYFSSNYPERSIGGLDIFRSVYIAEAQLWIQPQSLGMPINSAADDDHFRLARDGFTGFFDSARKDGFGQRDLYIAYFNNYLNEMEPPAVDYAAVAPPTVPVPPTVDQSVNNDPLPNDRNVADGNVLYFDQENELENTENTRLLRKISEQLLAAADRQVVITVYAFDRGVGATGMSQAIRSAERVAAWLTRQGVSENAIFMRGTFAAQIPDDQSAAFALVLHVHGEEALAAKGKPAEIFDDLLHEALVYKIQIASSKTTNYSNNLLLSYPYAMVEKTLNFEYYRYTVGAMRTFAEAIAMQREVRAKGISSAYIGAYVYGRRIDANEAKTFVTKFPDLQNFAR